MTNIIIMTRMKILMRTKLMLLLSGDLDRQYSPKFLSFMPRSPLEVKLKPHSLLGLRHTYIELDNLTAPRFFGWRLRSLFVGNLR